MSISGTIGGQAESATYRYDNLGRLATSNQSTNGQNYQRRFGNDQWGNRTAMWDATSGGTLIQAMSYQQSGGVTTNRIQDLSNIGSTVSYTYDAAGNVTGDGQHTYQYDAENRVVSVDGGAATYTYDQNSRRVKKQVTASGAVTVYVWEGSQVIAEYNGVTGGLIAENIYLGRRMVAKQEGATRRYYLSDRLSTRLVLDASGNITGRQAHLPYGEEIGGSGSQDKQRFTSYERDSETGLDYAIHRAYASGTGRFQSADPYRASGYLVDPQSWNRYAYTRNEPVSRIDLLGLEDSTVNGGDLGSVDIDGSGGGGTAPPDVGPDKGEVAVQDGGPPAPVNPVRVGEIPVPPPPPINNLKDLKKYWEDIKKYIKSKGKCDDKLKDYTKKMDKLLKEGKIAVKDARDPQIASSTPAGYNQTVSQLIGGDAAYTIYTYSGPAGAPPRQRPVANATIYLGPGYYASTPDWQAVTIMHEFLHASLASNDIELGVEFKTADLSSWIEGGCQ